MTAWIRGLGRFTTIALCALLGFGLAACAGNNNPNPDNGEVTDSGEPQFLRCVDHMDGDSDGSPETNSCIDPKFLDCDDTDPAVRPGNAETPCNGKDDDCNPETPDGEDKDMDGVTVCAGDCDDYDPLMFPGNAEVCDGQDNDCDNGTMDGTGDPLWDDNATCTDPTCEFVNNEWTVVQNAIPNFCDGGNVCIDYMCNPEAVDSDPVTGCLQQIVQGRLCDDDLFCTSDDRCTDEAACEGQQPTDCGPNDPDVCTQVVCDEDVNACVEENREVNAPCNDSVPCTELDVCDGAGFCEGSPNNGLCPDGNDCTDDLCVVAMGCSNPPFVVGSGCGDDTESTCNHADTCDGAGFCLSNFEQAATECRADSGACDVPENCDGAGNCPADSFEPQGTSCDDGDFCNGVFTCDGVNACLQTTPPVNTDDGKDCTDDSCDPANGQVTNDIQDAMCLIDGTCYANAALNPGNDCQRCTALVNQNAWTNRSVGAACGDGSDTECTNPDTCNGNGQCLANHAANGTFCGDGGTECVVQDTCSNGVCVDNEFFAEGTACGDGSDTECTDPDDCDGLGTCLDNHEPVTTNCGDDGTECVVQDKCNGAGSCTDNGFFGAGTACGNPADTDCDNPDTCNGAGGCATNPEPVVTVCRPDAGDCDVEELCDGVGSCPADSLEPAGTTCGLPVEDVCNHADTCDNEGNCQPNLEPDTTVCRGAVSECDVEERCNGAGLCPADATKVPGTPCGNPADTECTDPDDCDGLGTCLDNHEPVTTNCGDDGTECVVQDKCNGAGSCTDNGFFGAGTACGNPADTECTDPDSCDGAGACQLNHEPGGTFCGDGGTECVVQDTCNGNGGCTDNEFFDQGTPCGDLNNTTCDHMDTCNGAGSCTDNFANVATLCRADADECDVPENCDGAGNCPADSFQNAGTLCGDPTDTDCDNPDTCDGLGGCVLNFEPGATPCGDGLSTDCDNPDSCDGGGVCLVNNVANGVACNDNVNCTVNDMCSAGGCEGAPDDASCQNGQFCDGAEWCHPQNDCQSGDPNAVCDDGVACSTDVCLEQDDSCLHFGNDAACADDGLFCNGEPRCDVATGCNNVNVPDCNAVNGVCDEDVDACVVASEGSNCVTDNNCGQGTVCNNETGLCDALPPNSNCVQDNNCAAGTTCNAGTGQCDPDPPSCAAAVNPVVCAGGTVCNAATGACDPAITCGEGTVLNADGECVDEGTSCIENPAICPSGTTCNTGNGLCEQQGFVCQRDGDTGELIRDPGTGRIWCWFDSELFECWDQDLDAGMNNYVRCLGLAVVPGGEWSDTLDADDTNDDVYPGAPELCDGLDNDQDGLDDVADGLICDEICDGLDNNGDDLIDNGVPSNVGGQDLCRPSGVEACGQWAIPAAGSEDQWPVLFFTTLDAAVAGGCAGNAPYPVSLTCNVGDYVLRGDDANRETITGIPAANFDPQRAYRCQPTDFPHICTALTAEQNEGGWFCYK